MVWVHAQTGALQICPKRKFIISCKQSKPFHYCSHLNQIQVTDTSMSRKVRSCPGDTLALWPPLLVSSNNHIVSNATPYLFLRRTWKFLLNIGLIWLRRSISEWDRWCWMAAFGRNSSCVHLSSEKAVTFSLQHNMYSESINQISEGVSFQILCIFCLICSVRCLSSMYLNSYVQRVSQQCKVNHRQYNINVIQTCRAGKTLWQCVMAAFMHHT